MKREIFVQIVMRNIKRSNERLVLTNQNGGNMKEEIKVEELIETFRDMARRGTLLARGGVTQEDLLTQIEGTIVKVAME